MNKINFNSNNNISLNNNNNNNYNNNYYYENNSNKLNHIHKIYEGICQNCMNLELINLHKLKGKKTILNEDTPFTIQEKRNEEFNQQIKLKVARKNLNTENVAKNIINNDEKNKLINENLNSEFKLNIPAYDYLKQRAMERFKKNQNFLKKNNIFSLNKKVDDFYNKPNEISNGSVNAIGQKKVFNKYLPSLDEYRKFLDNQILMKEKRKIEEKNLDKENEFYIYKKNLETEQNETKNKNILRSRLKRNFLEENQKIINEKNRLKNLNKSYDIALENEINKKNEDDYKKSLLEKHKKKLKIRTELIKQLNDQINLKKQINQNNNNNDEILSQSKGNIYCEPIHLDENGKCIKCHRILNKNMIFPTIEYERIKEAEEEKIKEAGN